MRNLLSHRRKRGEKARFYGVFDNNNVGHLHRFFRDGSGQDLKFCIAKAEKRGAKKDP